MKKILFLILAICSARTLAASPIGVYQHGTVVRMHMGDCIVAHHGFMSAVSGGSTQVSNDSCPEYTLVTDKVVYVVVGKNTNQLIPLADVVDFRFKDNELAVRVDDERHEAKFTIKEMFLRSEWERQRERELVMPARRSADEPTTIGEVQ